jgi:hypothetical protein
MTVSVIMISAGVDEWDKLTQPAIQSLAHHASEVYEIIVMDNGGKQRGDVNTDIMIPYAEAVNMTARLATHERLVILNNDITARGDWMAWIHGHPYCGPRLLSVEGVDYIEGWFISIDMDLWHMMNGFNESYKNSWEDVDLAWRLCRIGITPRRINVPMKHVWGATRHVHPGSNKWDGQNRELLLSRMHENERFRWRKL